MTDEAVLPRTPAVPTTRGRRWLWFLATYAAVLLVGIPVTVWFVHWDSSLQWLVKYPSGGLDISQTDEGAQYFGANAVAADLSGQPEQSGTLSINVISVHPVVRENTADADIAVLRCVLRHDSGGPVGENRAGAYSTCASLTAFHPGRVTLGVHRGHDDIVIRVLPRRAGTVRISGVELSYRSGIRHGTQHTGLQIGLTIKLRTH